LFVIAYTTLLSIHSEYAEATYRSGYCLVCKLCHYKQPPAFVELTLLPLLKHHRSRTYYLPSALDCQSGFIPARSHPSAELFSEQPTDRTISTSSRTSGLMGICQAYYFRTLSHLGLVRSPGAPSDASWLSEAWFTVKSLSLHICIFVQCSITKTSTQANTES
jgi:hypothetical protein